MIAGYLSEYSLPEIFQFVEQGYKTGLLSIQPEPEAAQQEQAHYLWLQGGRIVAMAEHLDNQGLLSMLKQRGWLKSESVYPVSDLSQAKQPLGLHLKAQGAITADQIKLLFHAQVLRPVCSLFKLTNGKFTFEPTAPLPTAEMTGLSLSATEATLLGLRVLRDWTRLAEKLPDPTAGLTKLLAGKPKLQLDPYEWQMWEFADGSSLQAIAGQLQLPVETAQQIAFRMIVVGLVEEAPVIFCPPKRQLDMEREQELALVTTGGSNKINSSFLQNLVSFLKTKIG